MAVDSAIEASFADGSFQRRFGESSCLWRFYGWSPRAITLGRNQPLGAIDVEACRREGIEVVRRPTGGRAVLHADEFTYSFFCDSGQSSEVLYRLVHEVIAHALAGLGVESGFCRSTLSGRPSSAAAGSASCFTSSARYELQSGGRKLVGSAQHRSGRILLQHGSLPLSSEHCLLASLLHHRDTSSLVRLEEELKRKTVSLEEILGYIPQYDRIAELMVPAIASIFGTRPRVLQAAELDLPGQVFRSTSLSSDRP